MALPKRAWIVIRACVMFQPVVIAIAILSLALLGAAVLAYGTLPFWGQYSHGLLMIAFSRRWEWPLIALVVILCMALLALVISGKRRVWWLLGLVPILLLLAQRLNSRSMRQYAVLDNPPFVKVDDARFLADSDYVVGMTINNAAYAFPYATLNLNPVVVGAIHETRFVLLWSPLANRATASLVDRDIKGRDLEIVSMPANATLVYNTRFGQFINALTGEQLNGQTPTGFHKDFILTKLRWRDWKKQHPLGLVMSVDPPRGIKLISEPMEPTMPLPLVASSLPTTRPLEHITMIATTQPVAVSSTSIGISVLNFSAGAVRLLMFRDSVSGLVRVFDRRVWDENNHEEVFPAFRLKRDATHPSGVLIDADGQSVWTVDGKAVDGPWKGQQLRPIHEVDEDLYWGVMQVWYPNLQYVQPKVELEELARPPDKHPILPNRRRPHTR